MKKFQLKVPATTANFGPGFDAIGMALELYNEFEVEEITQGVEFLGCEDIPLADNMVYTSMCRVLSKYGRTVDGIRVHAKEINIPLSRGLGSSAASIVAGIIIANQLMNGILSIEDIISLGTEIEGHPDNIVPAALGGLTVSIFEENRVTYSRVTVPNALRFVVMIPDFVLSTYEARKAIPNIFSKADCVHNISRAAMLMAAMNNGEVEKLRIATGDKIHQPYRAKLIPGIEGIFQKSKELGAKAEAISGAGSTLMAVIDRENTNFESEMRKYLEGLKENWKIKVLKVDTQGVKLIQE